MSGEIHGELDLVDGSLQALFVDVQRDIRSKTGGVTMVFNVDDSIVTGFRLEQAHLMHLQGQDASHGSQ
jgi:hypothetical protein